MVDEEDDEDDEDDDDEEEDDPFAVTGRGGCEMLALAMLALAIPLKAAAAAAAAGLPLTEALRAARAVPRWPASDACDRGLAWYD